MSEKSNEITAIPKLLDKVSIKNSVVSIDAIACQKEITKKIIDKEADYLIALKKIRLFTRTMYRLATKA